MPHRLAGGAGMVCLSACCDAGQDEVDAGEELFAVVHNHGHVAGSGPSPYSLILLGDDMLLSGREEYDPERGTWRALAPGNPGRDNRLPARLAPEPRGTYKIAIGLTGDPVPAGSRSGAIMHRNDQRSISAHTCLSSVNCR